MRTNVAHIGSACKLRDIEWAKKQLASYTTAGCGRKCGCVGAFYETEQTQAQLQNVPFETALSRCYFVILAI